MPKAAKSKSKAKPAAKKKAAPKKQTTAKAKVISHTDDGTPIVNGKSDWYVWRYGISFNMCRIGMYEDMVYLLICILLDNVSVVVMINAAV